MTVKKEKLPKRPKHYLYRSDDKELFADYVKKLEIFLDGLAEKLENQKEDAEKELMKIFAKGKAPFNRQTHGKICELQGYIKAKNEDLEVLKG